MKIKLFFANFFCLKAEFFVTHPPVAKTAQKMKFSIKDFFSKCDQIRRKLRIWSHLLQKSLMETFFFFFFCGVNSISMEQIYDKLNRTITYFEVVFLKLGL